MTSDTRTILSQTYTASRSAYVGGDPTPAERRLRKLADVWTG